MGLKLPFTFVVSRDWVLSLVFKSARVGRVLGMEKQLLGLVTVESILLTRKMKLPWILLAKLFKTLISVSSSYSECHTYSIFPLPGQHYQCRDSGYNSVKCLREIFSEIECLLNTTVN